MGVRIWLDILYKIYYFLPNFTNKKKISFSIKKNFFYIAERRFWTWQDRINTYDVYLKNGLINHTKKLLFLTTYLVIGSSIFYSNLQAKYIVRKKFSFLKQQFLLANGPIKSYYILYLENTATANKKSNTAF